MMGIINLAHGAFYAVGAYTAWFISSNLQISFWFGLLLAPIIGFTLGLIVERVVVRYLYDRVIESILATWGVTLVISELLRISFGSVAYTISSPLPGMVSVAGATFPAYRLFVMGFSVVILLAVFGFIYRTNYGVRMRAVISNPENASLLGINQTRMNQFTFGLGAVLATLAGLVMAPFIVIEPGMGTTVLIESFFAIIVGGSGTLVGIIPGSIVVAGLRSVLTYPLEPILAQTIVFVIVIFTLAVLPTGFLGGSSE
jgi:branched-chain amino acid transport system permease protein/urea transport system permease protein